MARINLLPWREARREELKRAFLTILGLVAVFAIMLLVLGDRFVNGQIDSQRARNNYLSQNIAKLDEQVEEIRDLQRRRNQLIDRMRVIQELQGNRPIIVRVLDQLVRTVPDGVFYTSVSAVGQKLAIEGVAESNNRVSSLMRRLDASDWLKDPNLDAVRAAPIFGDQANTFELSVMVDLPQKEGEEGGLSMALEDSLRSLREFDINDISLDNIGTLPVAIKVVLCLLLLAAILAGGYYYHIKELQLQLATEQSREGTLKQEYEKKAFQVANLDAYRRQMVEMEESFGALISQLPSDTEVPGLLEDITNKGLLNGLQISSIDLQPEVSREFYVELPIAIVASGSYHDLGAFISGMAGLPRIVTLHDFTIRSNEEENTPALNLNITAKTYRYKDGDE